MKIKLILGLALCCTITSCKPDDEPVLPQASEPTSETFTYVGQTVTYGVIKRMYSTGPNGEQLLTPVVRYWFDRNLGAQQAAAYPGDSLARGDLFQWGRRADGHQKRTSDTTHLLATSSTPGHDDFIAAPLGSFWLTPPDTTLWYPANNANNVCPSGWHVATADDLKMELASWSHDNILDSFNSPLRWVPSGNRDNHGTERYSAYWAFIWSSTPADFNYATALAIIGGGQSEMIGSPPIAGHAVRCVKD